VIGGYTLPEGGRKYFGSLLVGYNSPNGLPFAGRVGTGFSDNLLASIDETQPKASSRTLGHRYCGWHDQAIVE
jgi:ATP-dependent DNA ligase